MSRDNILDRYGSANKLLLIRARAPLKSAGWLFIKTVAELLTWDIKQRRAAVQPSKSARFVWVWLAGTRGVRERAGWRAGRSLCSLDSSLFPRPRGSALPFPACPDPAGIFPKTLLHPDVSDRLHLDGLVLCFLRHFPPSQHGRRRCARLLPPAPRPPARWRRSGRRHDLTPRASPRLVFFQLSYSLNRLCQSPAQTSVTACEGKHGSYQSDDEGSQRNDEGV